MRSSRKVNKIGKKVKVNKNKNGNGSGNWMANGMGIAWKGMGIGM